MGGLLSGWLAPWYFHDRPGLLDSTPLRRTLERHVDFGRLREVPVRLLVLAADLVSGQPRRFDNASLTLDALMGSATVPGLFPAVIVDGAVLVDGGVVQRAPTPVTPAPGPGLPALPPGPLPPPTAPARCRPSEAALHSAHPGNPLAGGLREVPGNDALRCLRSRWAPALARLDPGSFYGALGRLLNAFVAADCARAGVAAGPACLRLTHAALLAFAASGPDGAPLPRCRLCEMPTRDFEPAPATLSDHVLAAIRRDVPAWQPADGVCRRCAEVYACRGAP